MLTPAEVVVDDEDLAAPEKGRPEERHLAGQIDCLRAEQSPVFDVDGKIPVFALQGQRRETDAKDDVWPEHGSPLAFLVLAAVNS
jgi:hypothetical protein